MNDDPDRIRARALVSLYAASLGQSGRELDAADNIMGFGDTSLQYRPQEHAIYGRVYITMALIDGSSPEWIKGYQDGLAMLNDPAVGGMYDRAGGRFVLDMEKEAFYLVRRFDVRQTSPQQFVQGMDRLKSVGASWTMQWFFEVSEIMHGTRAAPTKPVTFE